jgi:hypothetical protein
MDTIPDYNDVMSDLPTFYENRMSPYRSRNKEKPKLPTTRTDIQLEGKWTQTLAHEQFLFADDGNADTILMFTTARNLTNLVSADIIYGDGTFHTSPTQFTQLYTLHAMVDDIMYPLVFGLLPGKSEEIYHRYSDLLKTTCQQHQLQLKPHSFFIDFETATRNSAQRAFTQTCIPKYQKWEKREHTATIYELWTTRRK